MVALDDVRYVVDENLLSLGNGMVAVRRETARFSRPPVDALLPLGISDPQWIPIVGDRGWIMITNDILAADPLGPKWCGWPPVGPVSRATWSGRRTDRGGCRYARIASR